MKRLPKLITAFLISILLCIPSALAVFYYTRPMEDASYDLSLVSGEDGEDWEGSKGWMVYTNEAGKRKELTPDGFGGYLGLDQPGQTFYFSRLLNEKLESPTIQLGTVDRTVSVFLDDTLLYTDCPKQDNRIGYLKLPMLEWDRTDKVVISLPPDYRGRTLTIAQSTPRIFRKTGGFRNGLSLQCETVLRICLRERAHC